MKCSQNLLCFPLLFPSFSFKFFLLFFLSFFYLVHRKNIGCLVVTFHFPFVGTKRNMHARKRKTTSNGKLFAFAARPFLTLICFSGLANTVQPWLVINVYVVSNALFIHATNVNVAIIIIISILYFMFFFFWT